MPENLTPTIEQKTPLVIANIQQPHFEYVPLAEATTRYKNLGQRATNTLLETLTDPLTGLKNEKAFNMSLDGVIEAKNDLPEAESNKGKDSTMVLFRIDVDGFKGVNDTLGHPVGDEVLATIGGAIIKSIREDDHALIGYKEDKDPAVLSVNGDGDELTESNGMPEFASQTHAARPHGDEFDVVIEDLLARVDDPSLTMEQRIDAVKSHIRKAVNKAIASSKYNGSLFELGVGVSIGAAIYKYSESRNDFLKRGDAAMYTDKAGKQARIEATKATK